MTMDLPPAQVVCIAQAIYAEARGEPDSGKRAVAHVIINRSKKQGIPPCVIIRQPNQFQFKAKAKYSGKVWEKCWQIANYPGSDPTGGALFFRQAKIKGSWGHKLTTSIGHHNFYR
jgi:N-acetylmuramoyl-L-alanine amidase